MKIHDEEVGGIVLLDDDMIETVIVDEGCYSHRMDVRIVSSVGILIPPESDIIIDGRLIERIEFRDPESGNLVAILFEDGTVAGIDDFSIRMIPVDEKDDFVNALRERTVNDMSCPSCEKNFDDRLIDEYEICYCPFCGVELNDGYPYQRNL